MRIESQRHRFDIPEEVTYLNCAYMSPLLRDTIRAGEAGLQRKAQPWKIPATLAGEQHELRARGDECGIETQPLGEAVAAGPARPSDASSWSRRASASRRGLSLRAGSSSTQSCSARWSLPTSGPGSTNGLGEHPKDKPLKQD